MGAPQFFEGEVFGAHATIHSQNPWEIADRTRQPSIKHCGTQTLSALQLVSDLSPIRSPMGFAHFPRK